MARLVHIFFDTNLGNGHAGLGKLASKKKIRLHALKNGDCVLFLNRAQTALKMFASNGDMIIHYKAPWGRLEPETLRHLPNFVEGGTLNYRGALKDALTRKLIPNKFKGETSK